MSSPPVAPSTCAANHGRKRSRSTPGGVSVTAGRLQIRGRGDLGPVTRCGTRAVRRARRCPAGSGRRGRRACRRGTPRRRALLRTRRPRSRTRGARRAQSRHSCSAGHARHTARACDSRTTRASGRSPAGAKNRRVWPWQAASAVHVSGPVKMRLDIISAVMSSPSRPAGTRRSSGAGRGDAGSSSPCRTSTSEPDHKTICQRRGNDSIHRYQRWIPGARDRADAACTSPTGRRRRR